MSVAEAARSLGVSERTIWRRLASGTLPADRRVGRVLVQVELPAGSRIGEGPVSYQPSAPSEWAEPGPWPYTPEVLNRHRAALLRRRKAAATAMDRIAARTRPDPDGLTGADYVRRDRERVRGLSADHGDDR
jgi:excisionase family DNA binding protein